ncbi:B-cell receptor CD22-like [Gadus chalcogrammus]|uniref:B-cell receptor CD22-like n=1 Tax=Gadus chalcogrammus TaxID=1042646 RepID=UPI0024C4BE05|nr:B-cell receptor CD22-like [Gadus chalcogrammus]
MGCKPECSQENSSQSFSSVMGHEDGVRVEYRLDGSLFNIRRLQAHTKTKTRQICELQYADDCAILAHSPDYMLHALNTITDPNGQNVLQGINNWIYIQSGDSYSCAVEGYENLRSPLVYAPKTPSVTVSPSGEIEEGSSVTLSCSSDANPAANYTWFKVNRDGSSRFMNQGQQLIFKHILSSESGQFRCDTQNEIGERSLSISINVKYGPKHTSALSSPSGEIEEGSSVTLSCSSDANPAAEYIWFKNNQPLLWGPSQPHTFPSVRPEDRGTYRCQAENKYGHLSSNLIIMDVQYAPKTPSVTVSPSGEIEEGSSVALSCSSDAVPAAEYTWFKNNQPLLWGPSQPHTFPSVRPEDRGTYRCQAENKYGQLSSNLLFMDVQYAPKTPSVTVNPSGEIEEGSSVTLSCSSDANPAANYTWFREHGDSVRESGQNYTITNITSEHGGNYYCQAHNAIGLHNATFLV